MNLSDLLKKDLVRPFESDKNQIDNEIKIAKNHLASAKKILNIQEWDWTYIAAYNAMLQAGRALMFAKGYRPSSQEHHTAVVSFVQVVYSSRFSDDLLNAFSKARMLRNNSLYDRVDVISQTQAQNLVYNADEFIRITLEILKF